MNRAFAALVLLTTLAAPVPRAAALGPTPTVVSVTPPRGPVAGGATVTVTGTDFAAPMKVTFGGQQATTVVVVNATTITCLTPAHARGDVDVVAIQATPPESPSAPAVAAYAYDDPSYYVWVPRAPGSVTGGNPGAFDVTVVDVPNRRVVAKLNLNAADLLLPNDDDWSVTQVLFDSTGAYAFLGTAGTPGLLDSGKVFILSTAKVLDGTVDGDEVAATIDTVGNPYQLALSVDGKTLYAADGGSWAGSALNLPDGSFRAYDVTDRAAPALVGTPATVGKIPVLACDGKTNREWGTNSSFLGRIQDVGGRTVVTNAASRTLSVATLSNTTVVATVDVAGSVSGGITTSVPSPFQDDFLLVETVDPATQDAEYFVYRISTNTLVPKGEVALPVRFFSVLFAPFPKLELQNRLSWPHPDGESLVAIPTANASLAAWTPATGAVPRETAIQGGGPPSTVAYNDATGFFYAREADGGWTVFTVPDGRSAAPVKDVEIPDTTGVDSLRVVGNGSWLVGTGVGTGTGTSTLALVDGKVASVDKHKVVASVALDLDAAGGPSFPQPGANGGSARKLVTLPGQTGAPAVIFPIAGTRVCADQATPTFTIAAATPGAVRYELEIGSQYDFLVVPGAWRFRVKVPLQSTTAIPPRRPWLRVLRAAAGAVERPFYARANAVLGDGSRVYGAANRLLVCEPVPPSPTAPADGAPATRGVPPQFSYSPGDAGRFWIEFAGPDGFEEGVIGRVRVRGDVSGPASAVPSARAWRRAVDRARGKDGAYPVDVYWRVRCVDVLGREVHSAEQRLSVSE